MHWAFKGGLLALCLLFSPLPAAASDLDMEAVNPEDALSWKCGMGTVECQTGYVYNCSVSENGMTAVAAGDYVLVYDASGRFVCSFYEKTDHSHLLARMHDDWIELIESTGNIPDRYAAYRLDGTLITFAQLPETKNNSDLLYALEYNHDLHEERGVFLSQSKGVTRKTEDGTIELYTRDNTLQNRVHSAKETAGEPFRFPESEPAAAQYPDMPVDLAGNMQYTIQGFAMSSGGDCLIRAGNELLLFDGDGRYMRTFHANEVLRPGVLLHLAESHIQLFLSDDRVLLTYDRMGKLLDAAVIPDTEENGDAMETFRAGMDPEEWQGTSFYTSQDFFSVIHPDGRRLCLYVRQTEKAERNFSTIYGVFFLLTAVMIVVNRWKDARDSKNATETQA